MKFGFRIVVMALATMITPTITNAATNQSIAITPYKELSAADLVMIDDLSAEFFLILQSDGAFAAFSLLSLDEPTMRMFKAQADQLDDVCTPWDSISAGTFETLSYDTHRRFYYSVSENCHMQWVVTYRRTGGSWALSGVEFKPANQWK